MFKLEKVTQAAQLLLLTGSEENGIDALTGEDYKKAAGMAEMIAKMVHFHGPLALMALGAVGAVIGDEMATLEGLKELEYYAVTQGMPGVTLQTPNPPIDPLYHFASWVNRSVADLDQAIRDAVGEAQTPDLERLKEFGIRENKELPSVMAGTKNLKFREMTRAVTMTREGVTEYLSWLVANHEPAE